VVESVQKTRSEDTIIFSALTPGITDIGKVHNLLEDFFRLKQSIDHNDRFNIIVFTKTGPKYLEDFTLNADYVLNALKTLEPEMARANLSGGIFIAATFTAEVFKKISGKVFRLIILSDAGSAKIQEEHVFFLEDLLNKVSNIPFIMDIIRINTAEEPREDLKLMRLSRRTGGNIHEIQEVYSEKRDVQEEELEKKKDIFSKLSEKTKRVASFLMGDLFEPKEKAESELQDLPAVLEKLAKKKEIPLGILDDDDKMDIPELSTIFFESLAANPNIAKRHEKEKCTICFTYARKNQVRLSCPYCNSMYHKICLAIWAKNSYISKATPYIFRCPNCFTLLRLKQEFIEKVNKAKTPIIKMLDLEDILLEEYLDSIESREGPNIISTEDAFSIIEEDLEDETEEEEEAKGTKYIYEEIADDELQMIWCPYCNAMITNEYPECPKCNHTLTPEQRKLRVKLITPEHYDEDRGEISAEIRRLQTQIKTDYKSENFTDAIERAEKIIDLATKINEIEIINEQKKLINDAKDAAKMKIEITDLKRKSVYIKDKFNKLYEAEKYKEAYKVIEDFKQKNAAILQTLSIPAVERLFEETERLMRGKLFTPDKKVEKEFEDDLLEESGKIEAHKALQVKEDLLKEKKDELSELKTQIEKIDIALKSSSNFVQEYAYDEAISVLESTISEIDAQELSSYKKKLEETKEQIFKSKQNYKEALNKLEKLQEEYTKFEKEGNMLAALQISQEIISLADSIGNSQLKEKYQRIVIGIEKQLKELEYKIQNIKKELRDLYILALEKLEEDDLIELAKINKQIQFITEELEK